MPMLILAFGMQGISPQVATHIAVATSLATILMTSIPSIYTHAQKGAVRWDLVTWLTPGILFGSILGGMVALALSGTNLQLLLGCFLVTVGVKMLISLPQDASKHRLGRPELVMAGGGIGGLSAIFGIGGGSLTIPSYVILVFACIMLSVLRLLVVFLSHWLQHCSTVLVLVMMGICLRLPWAIY